MNHTLSVYRLYRIVIDTLGEVAPTLHLGEKGLCSHAYSSLLGWKHQGDGPKIFLPVFVQSLVMETPVTLELRISNFQTKLPAFFSIPHSEITWGIFFSAANKTFSIPSHCATL